MSARLVALALLVAAAPSPSPVTVLPGKPLPLRFKPHEARYRVDDVTVRVELTAGQEPQATKTDRAWTLHRDVTARGEALRMRDRYRPTGGGEEKTIETMVDARGRRLGDGGRPLPPAQLQMVFPEEPLPSLIAIFGQPSFGPVEWSTETEPSDAFPMRVRTKFEVQGTEVAADRECVVIALSAKDHGPTKDGRGRVEYWARGRMLFDPLQGQVVSEEYEERIDDVVIPPPAIGLQRVHRELVTRRNLVRP